jgi:hypothetical protein
MERLASAILIQAIKDWEDEDRHPEIWAFLGSTWFENLAEMAGITPEVVRTKLVAGTYARVNLRAAYR